jgi:hypothetical protein
MEKLVAPKEGAGKPVAPPVVVEKQGPRKRNTVNVSRPHMWLMHFQNF